MSFTSCILVLFISSSLLLHPLPLYVPQIKQSLREKISKIKREILKILVMEVVSYAMYPFVHRSLLASILFLVMYCLNLLCMYEYTHIKIIFWFFYVHMSAPFVCGICALMCGCVPTEIQKQGIYCPPLPISTLFFWGRVSP